MRMNARQLAAAREWIADCQWREEVDVNELSDRQVERGVQRHYEGGVDAFIQADEPQQVQEVAHA
jgi:hypothetical protein